MHSGLVVRVRRHSANAAVLLTSRKLIRGEWSSHGSATTRHRRAKPSETPRDLWGVMVLSLSIFSVSVHLGKFSFHKGRGGGQITAALCLSGVQSDAAAALVPPVQKVANGSGVSSHSLTLFSPFPLSVPPPPFPVFPPSFHRQPHGAGGKLTPLSVTHLPLKLIVHNWRADGAASPPRVPPLLLLICLGGFAKTGIRAELTHGVTSLLRRSQTA